MRGAQAAAGPTPAAKKQATVHETVSARTRGARRRNETSTLPIQPVVALNLARVYALHHDETFLHMAAVCTAWKRASEQACHLVRDTTFGELKSGRRTGRFDRPHSVCFMPNRSMVIADCDNFRLQFWSRRRASARRHSPFDSMTCIERLPRPTPPPSDHADVSPRPLCALASLVLVCAAAPPPGMRSSSWVAPPAPRP